LRLFYKKTIIYHFFQSEIIQLPFFQNSERNEL